MREWNTLDELRGVTELRSADPQELYEDISIYIDYGKAYAEDRLSNIANHWDEDLYVDIISSERFKSQQIKKKNSFLSENLPMTNHLDKIADYILYANYDNSEQEKEFREMQEEVKKMKYQFQKDKGEKGLIREEQLKQKLKSKPKSLVKPITVGDSTVSIDRYFSEHGDFDYAASELPRVNYTAVDKELNQDGTFKNSMRYWLHYAGKSKGNKIPLYKGATVQYPRFAFRAIKQMEDGIQIVQEKIDKYTELLEEEQRLSATLHFLTDEEKELAEKVRTLTQLRKELKAEYNVAVRELRKPVELNMTPVSHGEVISNDAWERLSLRDVETHKVIIKNYKELAEKYREKIGTTMWALLQDYEQVIQMTYNSLNKENAVILRTFVEQGKASYKELAEEILHHHQIEVEGVQINKVINGTIPVALLKASEELLEEWVHRNEREEKFQTCIECGVTKYQLRFKKDKNYKSGYANICRDCIRKRRKNKELV